MGKREKNLVKLFKKFIKNKGMTTDVLLSHFMILIVPIVINIIIESFIIASVKDVTDRVGYLVAENARNNMDVVIENAQQIAQQINNSDSMQSVFHYAHLRDNYEIKNSIELLRYTCKNSYDIDDIFVYNKDSDMVVTSLGRGSTKNIFDYYYKDTDMEYAAWRKSIDNCMQEEFHIIYDKDEKCVEFIEYAVPLSGKIILYADGSRRGFPAVALIRLNVSKFAISDEINKEYPGFELFAVAPDGRVIGNGDLSAVDGSYMLSKISQSKSQIFENRGKMYICRSSEKNDWIYVASIHIWQYNKLSLLGIIMVIIGTAIVFLLGIKLIKSFIKTNYGSVINLGNRLLNELNSDQNIKLADIDGLFEGFLDEHKKLNSRMEKISDSYYKTCVLRLLNGVGFKNDDESFVKFKEHMSSDSLCVLCCTIEDCAGLYSGSEYMTLGNDIKQKDASVIIINVLSELIAIKYHAAGAYINNRVALIVGNNGHSTAEFKRDISDIARQFADRAAEQFNIKMVIAVGRLVGTYSDTALSYSSALSVMPYSYILKNNRVVDWAQCQNRNDGYEITQAQKNNLKINILAGNTNGAIDIINELYNQNLECRSLSIEMAKCFVMEMSNLFDEILQENSIFDELGNTVQEIFKLNRAYKTKSCFEEMAEEMCNIVENGRVDKYKEMVDKIQEYIDKYFQDADLNVFMIANNLEMSRAYISKIFKEHTGESILDAIHKRRIEEAKKLLKENCKISDAAEQTGYVNSNVFIRNFKKYTGITPGQYKEAAEQTKQE